MHKPSEISLFTAKEQTLLVSTEPQRLERLSEDELGDLLDLVRRGRKKYRDLDVRQSRAAVQEAGRRSVTRTSNQRTLRKAEIFEDAVSRVSRHLSRAARASANELKEERLAAARSEREAVKSGKASGSGKVPAPTEQKVASKRGRRSEPTIAGSRRGSTSKQGKTAQARKDSGRAKKK